MNKGKLLFLLFITSCILISGVTAAEVSEKKDVSIFNISYYGSDFHSDVVGSLDSTIRKTVVDMGRFRVLEVRKRFSSDDDLYKFIERIKKIKEQETEIPEEVSFGHVIFTEADFNALISSFIVIIPEVTFFDEDKVYDEDDDFTGYEVKLITSYTVLDASTMEVVAKPEIETSGFSVDKEDAWLDAVKSVSSNLELELKKIPLFTIKTGVLEVHGAEVVIEKGKNMGIQPGYEFEIIHSKETESGFSKEMHAGLVLVKSVYKEISEATVLYGKPRVDDQLVEVPRIGVDGILYCHILADPESKTLCIMPGIKAIWSMGLYLVKPIFGIEVPIADMTTKGLEGYGIILDYGMPLNFYVGCDINFYMGRLQIAPTIAAGGTLVIPWDNDDDEDNEPGFTHAGFKGYVSVNYLVNRDLKFVLDVGYSYWFTFSNFFKNYGGILGGLALVWKS
ncbi:MAG: hypothetical protein JXB88_21190 [Spirochaetales bacterium]|nr:hypothetical protein [Spirochaetales bacterium]